MRIVDEDWLTEAQVIAVSEGAHAIMLREAPFTEKVIDTLTRCKIIARYGVGVDHIDLEAARRRGIYVSNVPDYCSEEVSDHAVALILACFRKLLTRDRRVREGSFESDINNIIHFARSLNVCHFLAAIPPYFSIQQIILFYLFQYLICYLKLWHNLCSNTNRSLINPFLERGF